MKKLLTVRFCTNSLASSDVLSIYSAYSVSSIIGGTSPFNSGLPPSKESLFIAFKFQAFLKIEGSLIVIPKTAAHPTVIYDGSSNTSPILTSVSE